ncbi:MAG: cytochrome b [Rhizomicrobium sp.]
MLTVNTRTQYGAVAIALHWLIALAVIVNIALGLYFSDLPRSDPDKFMLTQLHKSIGLSVLVLSVVRVLWRLVNPVPPLPPSMSRALRVAARTVQFLLYILIVAIPISGWAMVSSSPLGLPTVYFGWFQWPHLSFLADLPRAQKMPLVREFATVHVVLAWSAIVLVPVHIAGALYHQLVRRDNVLARMLPRFPGGKARAEIA